MAKSEEQIYDVYHVARLAAWAGDFSFCKKLIKKVGNLDEKQDVTNPGESGFQLQKTLEEMLIYSASLLFQSLKSSSEIREKFEKTGFVNDDLSLLETESLRGIIHGIEPVAFELRTFPSKLLRKNREIVMKRVQELMLKSLDNGANTELRNSGEWVYRSSTPYIRVEFTALGQIRAIGFWCEVPSPDGVRKQFKELMDTLERE
jgi:hypothetical protein